MGKENKPKGRKERFAVIKNDLVKKTQINFSDEYVKAFLNKDIKSAEFYAYLNEKTRVEGDNGLNKGYTREQADNFVKENKAFLVEMNNCLDLGDELDELNERLIEENAELGKIYENNKSVIEIEKESRTNFHQTGFGMDVDKLVIETLFDNNFIKVLDTVDTMQLFESVNDDSDVLTELLPLVGIKETMKKVYEEIKAYREDPHPERKYAEVLDDVNNIIGVALANWRKGK